MHCVLLFQRQFLLKAERKTSFYFRNMAVYLHISNLIIHKKSLTEKYFGGIAQFKKDFGFSPSEINQEDGQLIELAQMNPDEFDIEKLLANGLSFNEDLQFSNDFVLVYRYGDIYWKVDWLEHNKVFAWHKNSNNMELERVNKISNMTMDEIVKLMENGENLLDAIWIEQ